MQRGRGWFHRSRPDFFAPQQPRLDLSGRQLLWMMRAAGVLIYRNRDLLLWPPVLGKLILAPGLPVETTPGNPLMRLREIMKMSRANQQQLDREIQWCEILGCGASHTQLCVAEASKERNGRF